MRILCLLALIFGIHSYVLHLNIFYEKTGNKNVEDIYRVVIHKVIDVYNFYLIPQQIRIQLDEILAYDEYSQMDEYRELALAAGKENYVERINALKKIPSNVILVASSPTYVDPDEYVEDSPCRSRHIINMSSSDSIGDDTLTHLIKGISDWLSRIFGVKSPDPIENNNSDKMKAFANEVASTNIIERLQKCIAEHGAPKVKKEGLVVLQYDPEIFDKIKDLYSEMLQYKEEAEKEHQKEEEEKKNKIKEQEEQIRKNMKDKAKRYEDESEMSCELTDSSSSEEGRDKRMLKNRREHGRDNEEDSRDNPRRDKNRSNRNRDRNYRDMDGDDPRKDNFKGKDKNFRNAENKNSRKRPQSKQQRPNDKEDEVDVDIDLTPPPKENPDDERAKILLKRLIETYNKTHNQPAQPTQPAIVLENPVPIISVPTPPNPCTHNTGGFQKELLIPATKLKGHNQKLSYGFNPKSGNPKRLII